MAFGWASDDASRRLVAADILADRFRKARLETRYYTPAIHNAAFALPPYVEALTVPA